MEIKGIGCEGVTCNDFIAGGNQVVRSSKRGEERCAGNLMAT